MKVVGLLRHLAVPVRVLLVGDWHGGDDGRELVMGWAARLNQRARDGKAPARIAEPPRTFDGALAVFSPFRYTKKNKDGSPVLNALGKAISWLGFKPNAKPGQALSNTHHFDGLAVRRTLQKLKGKAARRADKVARRLQRQQATS